MKTLIAIAILLGLIGIAVGVRALVSFFRRYDF
jgi:hypothetical protein